MDDSSGVRMVQSLADLTADIQQIPDGKPFLARQHGCNTVALHILHGSAEQAIDFPGAIKQCDILTVKGFGTFRLRQNALNQRFRLLLRDISEPKGF